MPPADFPAIHARLKAILQKYAGKSHLTAADSATDYALNGPPSAASRDQPVWFGSVQQRKNYVSYHLIAVYAFPDLLADISPELKKRMQGKSCFNFKTLDEPLFKELAQLTEAGYRRLKQEKWVK